MSVYGRVHEHGLPSSHVDPFDDADDWETDPDPAVCLLVFVCLFRFVFFFL
jgi:hypothetical protein